MQISQPFVAGSGSLCRRVDSRTDYTGKRNQYAAIDKALDPSTLAATIRRNLCLEHAHA